MDSIAPLSSHHTATLTAITTFTHTWYVPKLGLLGYPKSLSSEYFSPPEHADIHMKLKLKYAGSDPKLDRLRYNLKLRYYSDRFKSTQLAVKIHRLSVNMETSKVREFTLNVNFLTKSKHLAVVTVTKEPKVITCGIICEIIYATNVVKTIVAKNEESIDLKQG